MSENPYVKRRDKMGKGYHGVLSEKATAKRLGARQTVASGALAGSRADMDINQFKIEAKSTVNGTLGLKLDWLAKVDAEARAANKKPALTLTFVRPTGAAVTMGRWVLLREDDFKELIDGNSC